MAMTNNDSVLLQENIISIFNPLRASGHAHMRIDVLDISYSRNWLLRTSVQCAGEPLLNICSSIRFILILGRRHTLAMIVHYPSAVLHNCLSRGSRILFIHQSSFNRKRLKANNYRAAKGGQMGMLLCHLQRAQRPMMHNVTNVLRSQAMIHSRCISPLQTELTRASDTQTADQPQS
jgi:hypothetical protein